VHNRSGNVRAARARPRCDLPRAGGRRHALCGFTSSSAPSRRSPAALDDSIAQSDRVLPDRLGRSTPRGVCVARQYSCALRSCPERGVDARRSRYSRTSTASGVRSRVRRRASGRRSAASTSCKRRSRERSAVSKVSSRASTTPSAGRRTPRAGTCRSSAPGPRSSSDTTSSSSRSRGFCSTACTPMSRNRSLTYSPMPSPG
jgi:hypothetical protein